MEREGKRRRKELSLRKTYKKDAMKMEKSKEKRNRNTREKEGRKIKKNKKLEEGRKSERKHLC